MRKQYRFYGPIHTHIIDYIQVRKYRREHVHIVMNYTINEPKKKNKKPHTKISDCILFSLIFFFLLSRKFANILENESSMSHVCCHHRHFKTSNFLKMNLTHQTKSICRHLKFSYTIHKRSDGVECDRVF